MSEVDAVQLYSLSNPEVLTFSNGLIALFEALPQIEETFYDRFVLATCEFRAKFAEKPNKYGVTLKEIDTTNDRLWTNTIKELKLGLEHPNEDRQNASEKIIEALDDLPNPTKLAYPKEYGWMDKYLSIFDGLDPALLKAAAIDEWVEALRQGCAQFAALRTSRTIENANTEKDSTQKARESLIDAYNDLVRRIEATLVLSPAPAYVALCDQMNALIRQTRQQNKRRARPTNPEEASIDFDIPGDPMVASFDDDPEDDTVTDIRPRHIN